MIEQATLIIALIGAGLLILYFINSLDMKKHFLMYLIGLFLFTSVLFLMPKVILDNKDTCDIVVNNSIVNGSTNTTTYDYKYFCQTNDRNTAELFHKVITWFIRLFIAYVGIYLIYMVFMWWQDRIHQKQ